MRRRGDTERRRSVRTYYESKGREIRKQIFQSKMENQRRMEERRNRAALDRALVPPHRPEGRRPEFRSKPLKKKSLQATE